MKLFSRHDLEDLGDDEPVFLIRARDAEAPGILRKLAFFVRARHGAHGLADEIEAFADEVFEWQHADGNSAPPPEPEEPVDVDERLEPYGHELGVPRELEPGELLGEHRS